MPGQSQTTSRCPRRKIEQLSLVLAVVHLVCAAPAAEAQEQARWATDPAATQRGQSTFEASCSFCHGSDARGSERAPDLIRSELVNHDEHGELIGQVLAKGRPDRGMPSFQGLSAPDIAAFLHDRIQRVSDRMRYPVLNVVTGDASRGKLLFDETGKCASCHSALGDLAGIGSKYKPEILQAVMLSPGPTLLDYLGFASRPVAHPPIHLRLQLRSGQTVSGVAQFVGQYDVALLDSSGSYRSFSRDDLVNVDVEDPLQAHRDLLPAYSDADMHDLLAYLESLK